MLLFGLAVVLHYSTKIDASVGDRSVEYQNCLRECRHINCTEEASWKIIDYQQPLVLWLTLWTCDDECRYECMWNTVDKFALANVKRVPQFYGKVMDLIDAVFCIEFVGMYHHFQWPFVRLWGLQEPASVFFSLLNFASFFYMASSFRHLHSNCSLRRLWLGYSLMGLVTWMCSAIFHTRDLPLTEKLDYFCAFGSILFGFYAFLIRFVGSDKTWKFSVVAAPLVSYFIWHVYYLSFHRFDYGYNMKANITVGVMNSVCWILWCGFQWRISCKTYVWRCAFVVTVAMLLCLLEVLDFPPILWTFDAHSLWHLGTSPLPLVWTKFVMDDCESMMRIEEEKKKIV